MFASTPQRLVLFAAEDSPSGLGRTLGKRVGGNPSRVRISYPPPVLSPGTTLKGPTACGGALRGSPSHFSSQPAPGGAQGASPIRCATLRSTTPVACTHRARIRAAPPGPQGPHDRVDHDVRDAKAQEDGRGSVASVTKTAVRPARPRPAGDASRCGLGVRAQRSPDRRREDVPLALPAGTGRNPPPLLGFLVPAQNLDQRIGQAGGVPARAGLGGLVLAARRVPARSGVPERWTVD